VPLTCADVTLPLPNSARHGGEHDDEAIQQQEADFLSISPAPAPPAARRAKGLPRKKPV
jgi:hypothetical protein